MDYNQILLQEFLRLCELLGTEYCPNTGEMAFKYLLPAKYSAFVTPTPLRINLFYGSIDIWIVQDETTKPLKALYNKTWGRLNNFSIEEVLLEIDFDIQKEIE